MNYTDEQYAMLDFFKLGARWTDVPETSMPVYWYLMEQKLICPREDIQPDWVTLTEYGKCVFSSHLVSLEQANQEARQLAQKNASDKKSKSSDRRFEVFLVVLGYVLGLITDHISEIFGFFCNLFS